MNQFDEPIQVFGSDLFSLAYELGFWKGYIRPHFAGRNSRRIG